MGEWVGRGAAGEGGATQGERGEEDGETKARIGADGGRR